MSRQERLSYRLWPLAEASLFMTFAYEGRVCINGLDMRVWSAARPEIQRVFLASLEFMHEQKDCPSSLPKVSALELAKVLCSTYVEKPVTQVIAADDDELCMKRIHTVMTKRRDDVVIPLTKYVANNIKLPVVMHDVVKTSVQKLLCLLVACLFWLRLRYYIVRCDVHMMMRKMSVRYDTYEMIFDRSFKI